MPSDHTWFDEPGDELRDEEYPEEDDFDDESTDTVPCPQCGVDVYDDAPQCPNCGAYITYNTSVWSGRPAWWIVLGLLGIAAALVILALC